MAYKNKTILLYQLVGQLSLSQSLRLWAPTQPSYHWKSQVPQWEGRASNHPHYHCKSQDLQQMGEQAVTVRVTFPTLHTFTTTRPATLNHGRRLHWWKNQSRTLLYLIMVSECLHSFGGFSSHRLQKSHGWDLIWFFLIFLWSSSWRMRLMGWKLKGVSLIFMKFFWSSIMIWKKRKMCFDSEFFLLFNRFDWVNSES